MTTNPRMEQALIGTALGFPTEVYSVTDVRPQDMAYLSHQCLWTIILDQERRNALSYQAVVEQLHAQNRLESMGSDVGDGALTGELYLQELLSRRAQPSIRDFADRVIGGSIKRQLKGVAQLLSLDADGETEADELLDKAEEALYQLRRNQVDSGKNIGDLLRMYEQVMDDWRADRVVPAFTFTTPGLANLIPFLEPSDFVLIAGRPGEGKSSIVRAEAFQAAMVGKKVVIFNLENHELEYARYLIAHITGIDTFKLRKPKELTPEEVQQVRDAIEQLRSISLRVVSMGAPTVMEIVRTARKLVSQGFEVIFVDYIQLIKNGIDNEVQDISMSSSMLRGFALKYNVPVIAAAQLNRDLTKRQQGAEPQLTDLRGSGSLEQDAVIVIFTALLDLTEEQLRRFPRNILPDGRFVVRAAPLRLFAKKNRNGPVGKTDPMLWDKSLNTFTPLTLDDIPAPRAPRQRAPQPRPPRINVPEPVPADD